MKQKKAYVIVGIVAVILAGGGIGFALARNDNAASSSNSVSSSPNSDHSNHHNSQTDLEKSQEITKTGVFDCLTPTGDGPHTMECAFGLTTDDGMVYGLGSDDPMLVGSIPTGSRIEVTGALQKVPNDKYNTAGTVKVTSVKQL